MVEQGPVLKRIQIDRMRTHLNAVATVYVEHVNIVHNGDVAQSCTDCLTLSFYLRDQTRYLHLLQVSRFQSPNRRILS